jgi:hypothetical protein
VREVSELFSSLLASQNRDGGWGYHRGSSWTEPTVYALLALLAQERQPSPDVQRGFAWLHGTRRDDGGWPPQPTVKQSTWVTALAVLLLAEGGALPVGDPAIGWLVDQTGRETSLLFRVRRWMLGGRSDYEENPPGWPWFPETAAWVAPTALTILALQKVQEREPSREIADRIAAGQRFLLARRCDDGGWNHGSSRALGYETDSYPETTGLALLALHGFQFPRLAQAIARAEAHLRNCRSAQGLSWLRMGLLAHNRSVPALQGPSVVCRNVRDQALWILAQSAAEGRNVFLSPALNRARKQAVE